MSDFLISLATRAMGLADAVRPRPAHIFEPVQVGETISAVETPLAPALPAIPQDYSVRNRREAGAVDDVEQADPAPPVPLTHEFSPAIPVRDQPVPGTDDPNDFPKTQTPPERETDGDLNRNVSPSSREVVHSHEFRQAQVPSAATFSRPRPGKNAIPVPAVRAAPPRLVEPEPTSPSIHVTIGRVEVRAVMTGDPKPRPAAAKRTGKISLEDYLKQHNGGRG